MKKWGLIGLLVLLLAAAMACGKQREAEVVVMAVRPDIVLRQGALDTGEMIFTSQDIIGVRMESGNDKHPMAVYFHLTQNGQKKLSESTQQMTGGKISLWLGSEMLMSVSVAQPFPENAQFMLYKKTTEETLALLDEIVLK